MTDTFTPEERSEIMRRVKGRDTTPELAVRRLVHRLGYRFRLQRKDLPGSPDLAFPSRKKVIFVHGCFWHDHSGCKRARIPQANREYWQRKISRNSERDKESVRQLRMMGWATLVVWECQTHDLEKLAKRLVRFLGEKSTLKEEPNE